MKSLLLSHKNVKLLTLHFAEKKASAVHSQRSKLQDRKSERNFSENFYINFYKKEYAVDFITLMEKLQVIEESLLRNLYWICFEKRLVMKLILDVYFPRCYIYADRIFINSVYECELNIKLSYVLNDHEKRKRQSELLLDVALACYIAAIKNINLFEGLVTTATNITQTAAANTATLGIESAMQVVGNAAAGAAVTAVMDVVLSSATIYIAKRQKDRGKITEQEFSNKVKKTVCENSCKFVAGTTGSIIGQVLIPVPVFGAFVGGFCGSLIGCGIGKGINYGVFDRQLKKQIEEAKQIERNQECFKQEQQAFLYRRNFHGYVPKITCYDEEKNVFFVKTFERTTKNFFKHEVMKTSDINVTFKADDPVGIKPFMDKLKVNKEITPEISTSANEETSTNWKNAFTKLRKETQNTDSLVNHEDTITGNDTKKESEWQTPITNIDENLEEPPLTIVPDTIPCDTSNINATEIPKRESFIKAFRINRFQDTKDITSTVEIDMEKLPTEKPERIKTSLNTLRIKIKSLTSDRSTEVFAQSTDVIEESIFTELHDRNKDKENPSKQLNNLQNVETVSKPPNGSPSSDKNRFLTSDISISPENQSNDGSIITNVKELLTSAISISKSKSSEDVYTSTSAQTMHSQKGNKEFTSNFKRQNSFTLRSKKLTSGNSEMGWLKKKMSFRTNFSSKERKTSNPVDQPSNSLDEDNAKSKTDNEKLKKVIKTWSSESKANKNEVASDNRKKKESMKKKKSSIDKLCNALNDVFQNEPL